MQSDVEVLKGTVERQKEVLAERERELVRRAQAAREEEFHKTATVHEAKLGSIFFSLSRCPSLTYTLSQITLMKLCKLIVCVCHRSW